MSVMMNVVGLLAILLVIQPSDCQIDRNSSVSIVHCQVDQIPGVEIEDGLPGPWISDLFHRALFNFSIKHVGSTACRTQSDMYNKHLQNHTSWAVRMSESWNRYPIGLLAGNKYDMGIYDECVDVGYPVIGQYCLSDIKLKPLAAKDYSFNRTADLDDFGNKNAWKTVLGWDGYLDKVHRNCRLNLGICIPNSCSALDLQTALQNEFDRVFSPEGIKVIARVDPIMCTTRGDMYPYDTYFYLTSIFLLMLVLICCGTTLYHYIRMSYNKNTKEATATDENVGLFCETFSLINSSNGLLEFDKDNELNSLYGFKVLMMMMILLCHSLFYSFSNHLLNPKFVESIYINGPDSLLILGNIVDPFFFVSGFLMYLNKSQSFQKAEDGLKKIISAIINRMLRLLPAYCIMMAITSHILPHLGDGPLWPKMIWEEAEICKNYWWTNLLFISNFIDIKYGCLIVNYYVSCDVQFFIVGVIIVYAYKKNTKYGIRLLATILSLSVFVPFLVTLLTKRFGIDMLYIPYIENLRIFMSSNESYRLSYMRATPFFSGLATSIIVQKLKEKKVKFSRITVYGGTFIVFIICISAQLYGAKFYTWLRPYYPLEHALYKVVNNCTLTVLCMWCFICFFTFGYGPFKHVLNNRLVMVLGRLSYSVFMVNITVIIVSHCSLRSPSYLSVKSLTDDFISDTFKCYLIALLLYLVVEAPFNKIIKRWIRLGGKIFGGAENKIKYIYIYIYIAEISMSITIAVGLLAIFLATRSSNGQVQREMVVADDLPETWISDLFYQALANFTVWDVGSSACRVQSDLYDRHLRNHTSWAVRMAESWDRYPIGILAGNTYHMGIYDECIDVRYPVIGQYCLSEIKLIPPTDRNYNFNRTEDLDDFGNKNAWKTVLGWGNYPDQVQRNSLNLGICIPNSCSASDLQTALQNKLDTVFEPKEFKAIVRVDPIMCTVKGDMYPYDTPYFLTSVILLLIFLICCGTTFYHCIRILYCNNSKETTNSEGLNSFCKIFSFIESTTTWLKFDKDNELNVFYGLKVLTMLVVLLGHRLFYILGNPMSNPKLVESIYLNGPNIILTSTNLVDPFFFMSGLLMQLNICKSYQNVKAGSVLKKIASRVIHRVIKMLPAYCVMMAITAHIVPHLGDGPLWPLKTWNEAEICKNYWWTNLLFISNLIDVKYECLIVSWYVSCDIQFFIIGVIIVYVYMKNKNYGIGLLGIVLSLSVSIPFLVTMLSKIDGIDKMQLPFLENLRIFISLNKSYRLSYMRATPFFCGIAAGFIVEKLKKNKFKFSKMTVYFGTFLVFMIFICIQLYGARFYSREVFYYPLEHALYSIVSHCTWTIPSMWIAACYFTSGHGPLSILFNNKLAVSLGKLSYSVFLVNLTVMMMSQSSQRLPVYLSTKSVIDAWIYDTVKSYMMGLMLYLVVEVPFAKLAKPWI